MATKKKTTKKIAPNAKPKKSSKAKRYTPAEKTEILAFVESEGRGGQTKASAKFGVSALTISNWRKQAGGVSKSSPKASKVKIKVKVKNSNPWSQMVSLKKDIDIMESKLEAKKAELRKFAAKL